MFPLCSLVLSLFTLMLTHLSNILSRRLNLWLFYWVRPWDVEWRKLMSNIAHRWCREHGWFHAALKCRRVSSTHCRWLSCRLIGSLSGKISILLSKGVISLKSTRSAVFNPFYICNLMYFWVKQGVRQKKCCKTSNPSVIDLMVNNF